MPAARGTVRPKTILILCLLAALAALAAWAGTLLHWALTVKPGSAIDYSRRMEELAARYQSGLPEGPNGWDRYLEAISLLEDAETELTARPGYTAPTTPDDWGSPPGPVDFDALTRPDAPEAARAQAVAFIEGLRTRALFKIQADLAATTRFLRPFPRVRLLDVQLPDLKTARHLGLLGKARMRLAAQSGDGPELACAFEQTLALGRICADQPTLIQRLVGMRTIVSALSEIRTDLRDHPPDEPTLRALLSAMDRQLILPPFELALESERLFCLDTIQWTHSDDGNGNGRFLPYEAAPLLNSTRPANTPKIEQTTRLMNLQGLTAPTRKESEALVNRYFDAAVTDSKSTPAQGLRAGGIVPEIPERFVIAKLLLPALRASQVRSDDADSEIAGTRVQLAIELFQRVHARYPKTLAELVPEFLPTLPQDPFFVPGFFYRPRAPDAADPRPYILYSVGHDSTDSGGRQHPEHNVYPWTGRSDGSGYDFIFNELPPTPADKSPGD